MHYNQYHILYTGDFRINPRDCRKPHPSHYCKDFITCCDTRRWQVLSSIDFIIQWLFVSIHINQSVNQYALAEHVECDSIL